MLEAVSGTERSRMAAAVCANGMTEAARLFQTARRNCCQILTVWLI